MSKEYQLLLTKEQAWLVATACEFYARIRLGQFREIPFRLMLHDYGKNYCERRDEAERLLFEARERIYPELHGSGHSYGIGKFDDADQAFDVFQVIRKEIFPDSREVFTYQDEIPIFKKLEESK